MLPVLHDRTLKPDSREPFEAEVEGRYDYGAPDLVCFERAHAMTAEAVEAGMTPIQVVLRGDYVEGTWAAARTPETPMLQAAREAYTDLVARTFANLDPIFAVSGNDLSDEGPVSVFLDVMERLKGAAPHCLTTLHTSPRADPPEALTSSEALDFYIHQSGHHANGQDKIIGLAERLMGKRRRPIMNAEPCYEAHGRAGGEGRFSAFDVRRATWMSLLAGAGGGIGYGAHGVWQWHRRGGTFNNPGFSRVPLTWHAALELRGAWDVGFAVATLSDHGLVGPAPRQDMSVEGEASLRVAERDGWVAAYTPFAQAVTLALPRPPREPRAWDLETCARAVLDAKTGGLPSRSRT